MRAVAAELGSIAAEILGTGAGGAVVAAFRRSAYLADEAGRRGAMVVGVSAPASPLAYAVGRARGIHLPLEEGGRASRTAAWSLVATAVRTLEASGMTQSEAIRSSLLASADRMRRKKALAAEAAAPGPDTGAADGPVPVRAVIGSTAPSTS